LKKKKEKETKRIKKATHEQLGDGLIREWFI
jgi:hypothetical protein